jgi:hypothetical protein
VSDQVSHPYRTTGKPWKQDFKKISYEKIIIL